MSNLDLGTVLEFIKHTCWPFVALVALLVLIIYRAPLGRLISKLRKGEIHRDKDKGLSIKVETDTEPDRGVSREVLPEQELEKTVRDSSEQEEEVSPEAERIPHWVDLMFDQEYKKAREEILSTIETKEPEKVKELRVWAAHFLSKYSFNEAVEEFKELVKVYPKNSFLYRLFAMAYAQNGLYEDAIAVLDNYPNDLPDLPSLRLTKAQMLRESGNPEQALDTTEELVELEGNPQVVAQCHLLRGKIFHSQDKADEAKRAYLSAYAQDPTGTDVIEKVAEYFQDIGDHETELYFRLQLVNLDNKSVDHWGYLGNAYVALNFYSLALDAYEKANELSNGSQAWILANIGNLYNNVGLFSKATEMLQGASVMIDSYEYAHNRLAQAISNSQKQRDSANQIIEAAQASLARRPEESSSA